MTDLPERSPDRPPARRRRSSPVLVMPDGTRKMRRDGKTVTIAAPATSKVDICFVFDTTGSMSDKLDGLIACMVDFVGELARMSLDWQISVVPFGDLRVRGDRVVDDLPFVTDRGAAVQMLRSLPSFSGGANYGESSLEAVLAALTKRYRDGAVKLLVLITDEAPHESQITTRSVAARVRQQEAICFVASPPRVGLEYLASATGGRWYPIGQTMNTSSLLDLMRSLVTEVPRVAKAVHELGQGSVKRYLELERRSSD